METRLVLTRRGRVVVRVLEFIAVAVVVAGILIIGGLFD